MQLAVNNHHLCLLSDNISWWKTSLLQKMSGSSKNSLVRTKPQAITTFGLFSDYVQHAVNQLSSLRVVSLPVQQATLSDKDNYASSCSLMSFGALRKPLSYFNKPGSTNRNQVTPNCFLLPSGRIQSCPGGRAGQRDPLGRCP